MIGSEDIAGVISTLKVGTALMALASGVWLTAAPPQASYPFVIVDPYDLDDRPLVSGGWGDDLIAVEAIDAGPDATRAVAMAALIDERMTKDTLSIAGRTVMYARRQRRILRREEVSENQVYWHAGGIYRITFA